MKIDGNPVNSKYSSLINAFFEAANFIKKSTPEGKEYYSLDKQSYILLLTITKLVELDSDSKNNQA